MHSGTFTVLVADDEPHILRVAVLKLSRAGFHVLKAHDGEAAWEQVSSHPVDLVVTDYHMPGLTGLDLAHKMCQDERLAAIPVILLTAKSFNICQQDLVGSNVVSLLSKPFSPRELQERVEAELETRARQRIGT